MRLDVDALSARLPRSPLTRFAPSPTGYLHLGHVVNAIYVWGIARALEGRVLLRIENHDRVRSRPEFEAALLEDLAWLGFAADAGPVRQSDDERAYEDALSRLARSHHVYPCDCSRKEIAAVATVAAGLETPYTGRCRTREFQVSGSRFQVRGSRLEVPGSGFGLRVEIAPGPERFDDGLLGEQVQDPSTQCGDLLLRDRDGHWTYQFAVTVDDMRQGIDLVIRGADLLSSTARQIRLARMLGRDPPTVYMHHGLVLKESGEKLSKSSGDTGVRDLRAAGVSAPEVIGRAAAACGLIDRPRAVEARRVVELFRS